MKKIVLLLAVITVFASSSCVRPTEECNSATNRPECESCCINQGMKYYDYINVDGDCYCEDV